jgi:exodeoxyribonuclease V alpha subunit
VRPGASTTWEDFLALLRRWSDAGQVSVDERRPDFRARCRRAWQELAARAAPWSAAAPPGQADLRAALGRFQLLCSTNEQVAQANRHGREALGGGPADDLPHATPVLITANRPALGLANGDLGLALGPAPGQPATVVAFPGLDAPIPLLQLPDHQPAFALTIHKSQGSEWQAVAIDLAPAAGDLTTRNLVYTAITRASAEVALCLADQGAWKGLFGPPFHPTANQAPTPAPHPLRG